MIPGGGDGRRGGGGVVTDFSEAHRPSVLFIFLGPTDLVYFTF